MALNAGQFPPAGPEFRGFFYYLAALAVDDLQAIYNVFAGRCQIARSIHYSPRNLFRHIPAIALTTAQRNGHTDRSAYANADQHQVRAVQ
jgi:hypothetical protein